LIGHSAGAHLAALTVLELSMKHLSDGSASHGSDELTNQQKRDRRIDNLQVSVIDSSVLSTSGESLQMQEKHFDAETGSGEDCICIW